MSFEKVCFVNQISQIFILLSGAMLHVNYDIHNTYSKSLVIKLTVKQSRESVSQLYKKRHPTAKKIIKLFNASAGNDAERQSFDHLKRFVKSLEGKSLGLFLHFCTLVIPSKFPLQLWKGLYVVQWQERACQYWNFLVVTNPTPPLLRSSPVS